MVAYLETFWAVLFEIAPFVLLGMLAAGFVHETLGRFHKVRSLASKRNFWSLSVFNLAGFTLPICSCGVIPLAVGLRRQGVPLGNIFTFIFSGPATSIAAVILSMAVLGFDFTLYYLVGAVISGYLLGFTFYIFEKRADGKPAKNALYLCEVEESNHKIGSFFLRAIRWGTITYGSRIAFDLIIGLALASLLISTYSIHDLGGWIGGLPLWQASIVMIAIAIPLYVCSLPGIIVAGVLVLGNFPPALVWIFLMAGPVTNLGDINVLRRNLGWASVLLYVASVIVVTLLWAWIIYANVEWTDMWFHVREYYATQVDLSGISGGIASAITESNWLGIPREVNYASALLIIFFTLNGAWIALKTFWSNPCRHCKHFQEDLRLDPAICRQPCWRSRLWRLMKRYFSVVRYVDTRRAS